MNMLRRDASARPDQRSGISTPARPTVAARPATPAPAAGNMGARPQTSSQGRMMPPGGSSNYTGRAKGDDLFMVMRQLTELLTKENAALKRHRSDEVKAFTDRKEQLARLYQGHMNAVHRDPNCLKVLDAAKREQLAQAAVRLGELMQENASLLRANITSINLFFKAVTDAVRQRQEEKAAAYSRRGALNGYAVTKRSLAVSFNQTM